jgi:hypothetical protein
MFSEVPKLPWLERRQLVVECPGRKRGVFQKVANALFTNGG